MPRAKVVAVIDDEARVQMCDQEGIDKREEQYHHEREIARAAALTLNDRHTHNLSSGADFAGNANI